MTKGIIFYTDNELSPKISTEVQKRIISISKDKNIPIVTAALRWKLDFGEKNIYFPTHKRGMLTLFTQIISALENSTADTIFFCEADILYHPSHFDFNLPTRDAYYYNINNWVVWLKDQVAIHVDFNTPLSMLCGDRELLLGHYRRKVSRVLERQKEMLATVGVIKRQGVSKQMSGEPGGEGKGEKVDNYPILTWSSEWPNLDLRHDHNLTSGKRHPENYHDRRYAKGWIESKEIPGWGKVSDIASILS